MFCVAKTGVRVFRDSLATRESFHNSSHDSPVAKSQSQVHPEDFCDSFTTHENPHNSSSREMPKNSFLKGFSWETYF